MIDKYLESGNKAISQFVFGNMPPKKLFTSISSITTLIQAQAEFGLLSCHLPAGGNEVPRVFQLPFCGKVLLKAMKLFRLKQIGTTKWFGGQLFLPSPRQAIRIQERIFHLSHERFPP